MNEITKVFKSDPVRIIQKENTPWFVAKDVCKVLSLANPRSSLALLDPDEKGVHTMDTPYGEQEMTIINESGLYSLILRSRKPEAKTFKHWVTHEVLPSIRKTGTYSISRDSTAELVEQINRKLLAGEDVPPHVLEYVSRIAGKPLAAETRPETKMLPFNSPKLSRTAQITMVFRSLPGLTEFLDRYTDWTPRTEFVNAFYQQYADFVCGVDRCRWWDALQRLRPLERTRTTGCQFIRFK